jgi:putative DNA primase/helicase
MLDWATGTLHQHDPSYLSTIQIPVAYDPDAACPNFDRFIAQVLPPDLSGDFIDEVLGYLVMSGNPLQKAFLLLGGGSNGKGTFIHVVQELLGRGNISNKTLEALVSNRFAAVALYGRLANVCGDLDAGRLESTAMFKMVTGEDSIDGERKGVDGFSFTPFATLLFSANKVFGTPDHSDGYFRRWVILPFPNSFSGAARDPGLRARLSTPEELSGVLVRAVRGLRSLMDRGRFQEPASVLEALGEFERESDPVRAFLAECTVRATGSMTQKDLHTLYTAWAAHEGRPPMPSGTLGQRLEQAGYRRGYTMSKRMVRGIAPTKAVGTGLDHGELIDLPPAPATLAAGLGAHTIAVTEVG